MKDEDTHGKKMARKGRTEVIYKGTFVSNRSLLHLPPRLFPPPPMLLSESKFHIKIVDPRFSCALFTNVLKF